ncbi:5'-deoxynucleotidase YfbR-like HD superfamily hydrolase [Pseudomonas fluorescens]|uniref:phosphohydrolase n=1 Tax=Pseudomonas fluorescens TaxID=294 RepID=UPI00209D587B|nr:phosphohydrolase [Pseudomonas fluorescens]MCP1487960.1 5'-deoxynucleotidase YfbR-like HD superfamily hydrolase [Pseudomonas fluorescens]
MNWILTHSGRQFNLVNPTAAMISPLDIAHALSNLCRFNGHTITHYSVAQHSLMVSSLVPAQHQLVALLHDATEAYVGDMTHPLKALMPGFRDAEETVWHAICDRFNLDPILPECVVRADLIALATERRDLMPYQPGEWECLRGIPARPETITPLSAPEAYLQFFSRLMELMQGDHRRACA